MKVVVVNYVFEPGMSTPEDLLDRYEVLVDWCQAVARTGARVSLVQAFSRNAAFDDRGVSMSFVGVDASRTRRAGPLHTEVLRLKPDVVHINGLDAPVQTWRLRQQLPRDVALVVQDHGAPMPRGRLSNAVRRRLMRDIDGYLFTAVEQAEPWVQEGLMRRETVHDVLEASTSIRPLRHADARQTVGYDGSPALLWVGRLQSNKDPLTVLEGFARLEHRLPAATLTMIYRDADLLDAVRARIARSAWLTGRVRLIGEVPRTEMAAWFSGADAFVLGSAYEVCGYSALEACACGAVPIVTDIPSFRAITGNGAIGRLWRHGEPQGFAGAVVAASWRLQEERVRVLGHFAGRLTWSAVGQRARAIYEAVVAGRRSAGRLEGA